MASQKFENLLNLALETPMDERDKSLELNIGYEQEDNTWEIIIKYHGNLQQGLSSLLSLPRGRLIQIEELIAGYAILIVPESLLDAVAEVEEIEYIEKPKRLFFDILQGKTASCILTGNSVVSSLRGQGVLVAVIDSGISWRNRDFRNADGTSRILFLWDQTLQAERVWEQIVMRNLLPEERKEEYAPPDGFLTGVEFDRAQINEALNASSEIDGNLLVPSVDTSGHGTAVAGIAAGSGEGYGSVYEGVAPQSELIIVKLGTPRANSFPRTTELMRALTYVVRKSLELRSPISINLSFGNTYGAHNGTSLLERFIDNVSEIGRSVICVGSGNEGASGGHTGGSVGTNTGSASGGTTAGGSLAGRAVGEARAIVELVVGNYETGLNVQLWKDYADIYNVRLISPIGEEFNINTGRAGKQTFILEQTRILLYNGEPAPYMTSQEIYFDFLPRGNGSYINSGVWTFVLEPVKTVTGNYTLYLPSETVRSGQTRFVRPTPDITLTIPSTASKVITVGAYETQLEAYADFSGRGYLYQDRLGSRIDGSLVKPDITAPGVNILAPTREGTYAPVTGTSFATPFVTGAAALLMQWGIVNGNDPYLYGEKVKAYLRSGAKPIRGENVYPNERVGYGALCLSESLPI
ncbi:MAG: S8 family peptidase [Lachnospiraceae bacterium]|nr:S8 family peptidase [Lachnospiraceae bacterium]